MSSNTANTEAPPRTKRSRGSSEETTLTPSHDSSQQISSGQSSVIATPQGPQERGILPTPLSNTNQTYSPAAAAAILESARRYENESIRRNNEARSRLVVAKEDVNVAVDAVKRAHDRLREAEQCFVSTSQQCKLAREYVRQWEEKFPSIDAAADAKIVPPATSEAAESDYAETDTINKHVSFAPQHALNEEPSVSAASDAGSISASTPIPGSQKKIRRKRIRVMEHGWGTYEGTLDSLTNEQPQGRGTVTWENGSKYSGDWVNGKAHGHGVMDYSNGDKYEGDWREGSRYGHGTHHFKDGGVYCGQWRNAAPDGQGKMTLGNGSHYVGSWKEGKWHGHGIVRPVNGGEWEGMFHDGKCTVGTLRRPNGEIEIGRYDSVNPDDVKEGVWWGIDRSSIWRVDNGVKVEEISAESASDIANELGIDLPKDLEVVADGTT